MGNEYIDSMLNHTANKLKENSDKLAKTGTFIDRSVNDLAVSINAPSEVEMTIPEDGVYVVTASNTWGINNADLTTYLGIIHNSGNAVASSRGNMADGGGLSAACIIDAKKNDIVKAQIWWGGGGGSATANRVRFRATRVGGGQ